MPAVIGIGPISSSIKNTIAKKHLILTAALCVFKGGPGLLFDLRNFPHFLKMLPAVLGYTNPN